jgi:hypothetical protein
MMKTVQKFVCGFSFLAASAMSFATTHYIVALDNTTSSTLEDRAGICQKSTLALVEQMKPKDTITLVSIDHMNFAGKHELLQETFSPKTFNPLHVAVAKQELNNQVKEALSSWLKITTNATLAFDAVYWAGDRFKNSPATTIKKLLVCSDGIEESNMLNMRPTIPTDALERVVKAKKVHEGLKSVEVMWVGLGGGEASEHTRGVESLWRAYFQAAGATVTRMGRAGLK